MSLLLFRTNHPVYLILLPIFALLFWLPAFFVDIASPAQITQGLFNMGFENRNAGLILGYLAVLLEGLLLSQVVNEREFFKPGSYLPGMMYVLLMVTTNDTLFFSSLHVANLFIILALRRCMAIYGKYKNRQEAFDAGFLIGLASLFHFYAALVVIGPIICLLLIAQLNVRELVISLYGLLTPWAFMLTLMYVIGYQPFRDGFELDLAPRLPHFAFDKTGWWHAGIFGGILVFSFFHYLYSFQRSTLRMKAEKRVVLIFLLVQTLALGFFGPQTQGMYLLPFVAVPLSVFLSFYFFNSYVKWVADLSFLAWLGIVGYTYFLALRAA